MTIPISVIPWLCGGGVVIIIVFAALVRLNSGRTSSSEKQLPFDSQYWRPK